MVSMWARVVLTEFHLITQDEFNQNGYLKSQSPFEGQGEELGVTWEAIFMSRVNVSISLCTRKYAWYFKPVVPLCFRLG